MAKLMIKANALCDYSGVLNDLVEFERFVTLRDNSLFEVPEHLPENIRNVFQEANSCLSSQWFNAAGAIYRLAFDLATKELLPKEGEPNARTRRSLGLRASWLFENGHLPQELFDLAECIREDGNDGAHDGTLSKEDAEDLHEFTYELLRRKYTEPARIVNAEERRRARRDTKGN